VNAAAHIAQSIERLLGLILVAVMRKLIEAANIALQRQQPWIKQMTAQTWLLGLH
jgi:hypothetical protein